VAVMTRFEDQLFDDLMREHGSALTNARAPKRRGVAADHDQPGGGFPASVTQRFSYVRSTIAIAHRIGPVAAGCNFRAVSCSKARTSRPVLIGP
jgi:hypothetical protein